MFSGNAVTTYTSMKENCYEGLRLDKGKDVTVVDVPGDDRLRKRLFSHWLADAVKTLQVGTNTNVFSTAVVSKFVEKYFEV